MVKPSLKRFGTSSSQPGLRLEEVVLPAEASKLGHELQEIARNYLMARRRRGEALLDAATWLSQARSIADEGRWYLFLEVTGTSHDVAERLLNIHLAAQRDSRFREAVISGHFNQSVAALVARPSTPPSLLDTMLESTCSPRISDVQRAMLTIQREGTLRNFVVGQAESQPEQSEQQFESTIVDNPHNAGSFTGQRQAADLPAWVTPTCEQIARARTSMLSIHGELERLDDYGAWLIERELATLREAVERISKTLHSRSPSP
jgi:hypothetical protein